MSEPGQAFKEAVQRKGSFAQSLKAVAWSFFGVRKGIDHAQDVAKLNPIHIVVAGLILAAVFVGVLAVLVRWVVASGAAL